MEILTSLVHAGLDTEEYPRASSVPIYQASTFPQSDPEMFGPYNYARSGNPTRGALEKAIASLEGGETGLAFASGIAAVASTLMLFKPGDHIVACEDIYGGAYRVMTSLFARWGLLVDYVDATDTEAMRRAIRPETVALYVESPSNPLLSITDLKATAALAKEKGLLAIIDNTFMTPYLQRPLEFGFDVSLHSATKFLGGHSDLVAGLAVTATSALGRKLWEIQNAFGAVLGPQDSWLTLRGIRTLAVRMDAQQKTATHLAGWLQQQAGVVRVNYPGLPGHPGQAIHAGQSSGPGAVLSFELESGAVAKAFLRAAKVPLLGVSLGGVESILSYPATMSHAAMPAAERSRRGISDGLVRLSVGLESVNDLMEDFEWALAKARNAR